MGVRSIQRNIAKNKYAYLKDKEKLDIIFQKAEIFRNGITAEDLEKEFKKGYGAGWNDGREKLYKSVLACICLVMNEDGYSDDDIIDFLHMIDNRVLVSIDEKDELDEVFERLGIELRFTNAVDRIERISGGE